MKQLLALCMILMLVTGACSSGASDSTADAETADDQETFDSDQPGPVDDTPPSAEFCDQANQFVTNSDVRLITAPDADVFAKIDADLAVLTNSAPQAVSDDIGILRDGFAGIGDAYKAANYDPTALLELPSELLLANGGAVRNLENYLIEQCELDDVRAEQIDQIVEAFGLEDADLAECIHAQLGDVANIEPSSLTPELMTSEVCGTSIIGLLSGAGDTTE